MIGHLDPEALAKQFAAGKPFPSICIDNFLDRDFVLEVARSYPAYSDAAAQGRMFRGVNERRKIEITNPELFPDPVKRLADYCKSPEFIGFLEKLTGVPNLLWDPTFLGGGMHQTAAHGLLDVHVDFNRRDQLYRRVNLLLYLNEEWKEEWGGRLELWDKDVKVCHRSVAPILNRCVIFETSEISYHGVTALSCPEDVLRRSFALYYYTAEAPSDAAKETHTTIFRARPNERLKRYVLMPALRGRAKFYNVKRLAGQTIRRILARD